LLQSNGPFGVLPPCQQGVDLLVYHRCSVSGCSAARQAEHAAQSERGMALFPAECQQTRSTVGLLEQHTLVGRREYQERSLRARPVSSQFTLAKAAQFAGNS